MNLEEVILRDDRASQPAAATVPAGTIYYVTDENVTERNTGSAWEDISDAGSVADDSITDAKLRESAALSVIGRSANSTGNPADIAAGSDGHILRRSGTSLGFGTIVAAGIAANAVVTAGILDKNVTYAKIQDITATDRLLGRDTAGSGVTEELVVASGIEFSGTPGIRLTTAARTHVIGFAFDGSGSPLTVGLLSTIVRVPIGGTLVSWSVMADQSGDIEFDIYADAPGTTNPPTTSVIGAGSPPDLTGGASDYDSSSTLTSWTTTVTADHVWRAEIISTSGTIEQCTVQLTFTASGS